MAADGAPFLKSSSSVVFCQGAIEPVTYKDMYLTLMGRLIQLRTFLEASDPEMYQVVVDGWLDKHIKY